MSGSTPCRYSCRDLRDRDGNPFERCGDSESVESVESVEVEGVVAPGRGRRDKKGKRGRNPSMMYTQKGKASKGSGGCPGTLEDCIAACPDKVCAANCGRRCSKK